MFTKYIWVYDEKINMRREVIILAFISWYLNLDVLTDHLLYQLTVS